MMKLTGVLLLLGILTISFARGHKKGGDDEAETRATAIVGDEEYVSWSEARGYEECEEFMHRGKGKGREARSTHKGGKKAQKPKSPAESCEEYECPKYEESEPTGCGFGVRNILGAKWVSTDLDINDIDGSFRPALARLYKYIIGANDQRGRMIHSGHTVPLIIKWYGLYHETDDSFELTGATMHKYIAAEFQENTPRPTDRAVHIEEWIDTLVYYRAFGGDSMDLEIFEREFGKLAIALKNEEVDFYEGIAITGVFTKPGHGRQRHEVLFIGR